MRLLARIGGWATRMGREPEVVTPLSLQAAPQLPQIFDARWYLERNSDVAAAGMDPLTHFLEYGEAEGRDPNPNFSTRFYRENYMQGEPAEASPLRHYLLHGQTQGYDPHPKYKRSVNAREQSYGLELPELWQHIALMTAKPLFIVYLMSDDEKCFVQVTEMLQRQIYEHWILCTTARDVLRKVSGLRPQDWYVVILDGGEILHSSALYCFVSKINERPTADLIYADEDEVDESGDRVRPFFKPDWSPDYLESFNFVGTAACLSGRVCEPVLGDARGPYDLLLLATDSGCNAEHIRQILVHRSSGLDAPKSEERLAQEIDALRRRLRRTGRSGDVTVRHPGRPCYDTRLTLRSNPLVSIVIPTAGKVAEIDGRSVDLLFNCLNKLKAASTYKNIEIIIVHNGDLGSVRLDALTERGVRILAYRGEVNVARKLNIGAAESRGDYLLLLNDDTEPIAVDWIERMLEHFEKPHVGVVGAKLLFPSMAIQHAGVVMIKAKPDHLRFKYPRDDLGYYFSTCAVRNFSAVTGAVMMTPASLFKKLGGYTEDLPINFNDVDYCLKATRAGFATVYAPEAELVHYESMSRARTVSNHEVEYFERQWADFTTDPYYNESMLNNSNPDYKFVPTKRLIG